MVLSNFPSGVSSFGLPLYGNLGGFIPAGGRIYYVWPAGAGSSDSNNGLTPTQALKTLSKAHTLMTANQNDTAIMIGNSSAGSANTVRETATLVWSKNLCHILGTSYNRVSHRCSIRAVTNDFTPLVSVTADGCVFANFHVFHGYATNEAQIAWAETGQRNAHFNLHIAGMGAQLAADHTGSRNMTITGDGERLFEKCTFGVDTMSRGAANAGVELISEARRDIFDDCMFLMHADAATPAHVKIGATGLDRFVNFTGCKFINGGTFAGGNTIDTNFDTTGPIGGVALLQNCVSVGADDWEDGNSGDVYVEPVYANNTTGIMVTTVA